MKLPTKLVAVKKISSNVPRDQFSSENIDKVAQLILEVEGTINPIILRRTSLESYEVVSGHFEYYAAVKAREISLLKGEMIQAIILEPENQEVLLEQVSLLRDKPNISNGEELLQLRKENQSLKDQVSQSKEENQSLKNKFKANDPVIDSNFIQEIKEQINQSLAIYFKDNIENQLSSLKDDIQKIKEKVIPPPPPLINLNTADKKKLTSVPGLGSLTADKIIQRRKTKGNFTSIDELSEIVSSKTITTKKWVDYLTI